MSGLLEPFGLIGAKRRGAAALLKETFTGVDGTVVTSRSMDSGQAWTMVHGIAANLTIQSGRATNAGENLVVSESGRADVLATFVFSASAAGGTGQNGGVILRQTGVDISNMWTASIGIVTATTLNLEIREWKAGVSTVRASLGNVPHTLGVDYPIKVKAQGQTISMDAGTLGSISYTLAAHNELATKHGFWLGQYKRIDNFEVSV